MNSKIIYSINIDSREETLIELKPMIREHEPLFVLVQDLPERAPPYLRELFQMVAPSYIAISDDEHKLNSNLDDIEFQKTTIKLDNVIFVHPGIIIVQVRQQPQIIEGKTVRSVGIEFKMRSDGPHHKIFSLYIRPRACALETQKTLDWISYESYKLKYRVIVMGDMNAIGHEWTPPQHMLIKSIARNHRMADNANISDYTNLKLNRGIAISNFMMRTKLNCLNKPHLGPTYVMKRGYANSNAFIDLALIGWRAGRVWREFNLISIKSAEHKLVEIRPEYKISEADKISRERKANCRRDRFRYAFYKINGKMFEKFKIESKSYIKQKSGYSDAKIEALLDNFSRRLELTLRSVQEQIKVRKQPAARKNQNESGLFTRLRIKHLEKMNSLRQKQKILPKWSRCFKQLDKIHKNISFKMRQNLGSQISKSAIIEETWKNIAGLDPQVAFEKVGASECDANLKSNDIINSRKKLEEVALNKFPFRSRLPLQHHIEYDERQLGETCFSLKCSLRREEVDMAMKRLRNKRYAGVDGINLQTLVKSYVFIREEVYQICRMSFEIAKLPTNCETSLGKLIPKKEVGKFRIVHLSTAVSALLEQLALRKLEFRLENLNLLSQDQYAFSANLSRHDLIAQILAIAHNRSQLYGSKTCTMLISLDIEGAFDNVNQDMLITKLMRNLKQDTIKYWLANFMLQKKIVLKHKNFVTQSRHICTGVPQGSSLGPILWNFMINDIGESLYSCGSQQIDDRSISTSVYLRPKKFERNDIELLAYADDIYILYKGFQWKDVQQVLNNIADRLSSINLKVNPEKSKLIDFRCISSTAARQRSLFIDSCMITQVNSMNILGVNVTRRISLDIDKWPKMKLANNMRKLYFMHRMKLMKFNYQWDALIDGLIRSLLTVNNFPILALDPKARDWNDRLIARVIRNVLRWPKNVSIKLVRLISNIIVTSLDVKYQTLMRMIAAKDPIKYVYLAENLGAKPEELPNDETLERLEELNCRRKYHDPRLRMNFRETQLLSDFEGGVWIPIETRRGTIMIEYHENRILRGILGVHSEYSVTYFNTMASIWNLIKSVKTKQKVLLLGSPGDSLLAAMMNWNNHDWRTIETKELLARNNWTILKMPSYNLRLLKEEIISKIPIAKFDLCKFSEPDITDYWLRSIYKKTFAKEKDLARQEDHTTVTKGLCSDQKVWLKLNRAGLSSVVALALTGVISTDSGSLISGKLDGERPPHGCQDYCESSASLRHTTLHRVMECPRYETKRREILGPNSNIAVRGEDIGLGSLKKALRLLTICAFEKADSDE